MACDCCGTTSASKQQYRQQTLQGLEQPEADLCLKDYPKPPKIKRKPKEQIIDRDIIADKRCKADNKILSSKLKECIQKFDRNSPDVLETLAKLNCFIEGKADKEECYPKKEWPQCPAQDGPQPYELPHPYVPGMTLYSKPMHRKQPVQVTLDGRMAEMNRPRTYYHEEPPLNVPPWVLPRYKSQELRSSLILKGCQCWKKNGLQDDCPRWDCAGRPECLTRPLPSCPPAMIPPICGVRKPNMYAGVPPTCVRQSPPPPFPTPILEREKNIPSAPSVPCRLHE